MADQQIDVPTPTTDRVEFSLMITLMIMTFVTGVVDAVSYVGLGHVFTANMTGNLVLLGFAVVGAAQLSVARSLVSLAAFMVGAAVGGRLALRMIGSPRRRWLLAAGATEAAMLFTAAVVTLGARSEPGPVKVYAIIILTALPMGLRTATVRKLTVADITTTVLTTTLAGLAADSAIAGGTNPRVQRRIASVLTMFAGAAVGTLLLRLGLALPLLAGGACVLAATIFYARGLMSVDRAAD
jgi:uncharacterized membrane protein YoaK (UPF0700 family)